jgi:hypothetical protein
MRRLGIRLAAFCLAAAASGSGAAQSTREATLTGTNTMKIRITVNGHSLIASLDDSDAARDFAAQLPMSLTLEDYAATEKINYLPRKLSTVGAARGMDPSAGDITYYAPWGNLAIFYRDAPYATGLVKLGRIETGIEVLQVPGPLQSTIELIKQ